MTAKAALCKALLDGRVVNIKNGFTLFGITNIPREIGRSIEREGKVTGNKNDTGFGVEVSRTERTGETRYGQVCNWTDYRLNDTDYNKEGIQKMRDYVAQQSNGGKDFVPSPTKFIQKDIFENIDNNI